MTFWQITTFIVALLGIISAITLVDKPAAPPDITTMYAPPPRNPYQESVSASGIVESFGNNIVISPAVDGLVQEVYVSVGDKVSANQILVQIDNRKQLAQVAIEKESVAVAQAQLAKFESQLERLTIVGDERAVSKEDLKNKQYDVNIAKQEIELAKARLHDAEVALALTTILAPKDGVILRNNLRKGEFASANSSLDAPLILGTISELQVRVDIDEQNAYRIRSNQEAICYIKGTVDVPIPLKFGYFELVVIPKTSLTSAVDEKVDTRVLQVIYTFDPIPDFPVYVGQQVDVFIKAQA